MLTGGDDGSSGLGALEDKVNALTAMDDPETMENENGAVTQNAAEISRVDGELSKLEVDGRRQQRRSRPGLDGPERNAKGCRSAA